MTEETAEWGRTAQSLKPVFIERSGKIAAEDRRSGYSLPNIWRMSS